MTESAFAEPIVIDEIEWGDLISDLNEKRCVLFLGPTLPVYWQGEEKIDFYSKAALHLSKILTEKNISFDASQAANLQYISRKFLTFKKDVRFRLDDEIWLFYAAELERLKTEGTGNRIPEIYKNIAKLPWDTIVNTQPDRFLEHTFKKQIDFHYYHYKSKTAGKEINSKSLLIYNLFGSLFKEKDDAMLESLVLTEEDQVDFVRNVIRDNPSIPENVLSRFDEKKRYVFLDFNLENWHFRLLLEALKLKKTFSPISPRHLKTDFSFYTKDFYRNRYGFVFIKNNSEEFLRELVMKYQAEYPAEVELKLQPYQLFMAYHDEDESNTAMLIKHLDPWVKKGVLDISSRQQIPAGGLLENESQAFDAAGCIILIISADALNEPFYSKYIKPAVDKAAGGTTKVIAIIMRECAWEETAVNQLNNLLPADRKSLRSRTEAEMDEKYKLTANAISEILW